MVQPQAGDAYPAALVSGTLVVTENNCLALAVPTGGLKSSGEERYAVYWAHGSTATRDPEGKAVLYDGRGDAVAREGDIISLGGGLMPENFEFPERGHPCNVGEVWVAAPDIATGSGNSAAPDIGRDDRASAIARGLELASKESSPSAPLDVTGDSRIQARRDVVRSIVEDSGVADGGLLWDADTEVLTINVVETEQTAEALAALKITLASRGEPFDVYFKPVEYSRVDLEALAHRLLSTIGDWAPGLTGAGGGFDPELNRVVISVRSDVGLDDEWSARVEQLDDPRVSIRTFTPVSGAGPQSR